MSRFNTGNPLDSDALQDLSDNAKNADLFSNDVNNKSYKDRFGRNRKTIHGMESEFDRDQELRKEQYDSSHEQRENDFNSAQDERKYKFDADQKDRDDRFNEFLSSSGYQFLGDYKTGVELTEYNQLVRDENGEFWRLSGKIELPYTTTGLGVPEDGALVSVGDAALRQELADPDKGAAMVARGVVAVDSIADLLALPEGQRKEGLRYLVKGYHAGSDVGGGEFYWDAESVTPDNGGTVFAVEGVPGRFIRTGAQGSINALWFGAVGGDAERDTPAIQNAVNWIASLPETTTYPYTTRKLGLPKLDLPYYINRPIHATFPLQIETDGATLEADVGFASMQIFGVDMDYMLVLKPDASAPVRWGADIPKGLILRCRDRVDFGIYTEKMLYSKIQCEVQDSVLDSIVVGPQSWGINLDEIVIENFGRDAVAFLTNSAANGGSMNNPKIWGEFKEGNAGIRFDNNAECNGFIISGGFIEKVLYGIIRSPGAGLITVDGIDFEYCKYNVIRAVGTSTASREKMIARGSFLHTTSVDGSTLYCSGMDLFVEASRFYNNNMPNVITANGGFVYLDKCAYPDGVLNNSASAYVVVDEGIRSRSFFKAGLDASTQVRAFINSSYENSPSIEASSLKFVHAGGDDTIRNHGTVAINAVSCGAAGSDTVQTGIVVDTYTGSVRPSVDGGPSLGSASYKWDQVYAANGTISTSDEREKQDFRSVDESERAAAVALKGALSAFKFKDAVAAKGQGGARWHFGIGAQTAAQIMRDNGLTPENYGFFCYDAWDAAEAVIADDGTVISDAVGVGDRFGIRYDELAMFILASI